MKWKLQPEPKEGDIRRVVKFAFFPTITEFEGIKYRVWLETYQITECYVMTASMDDFYRHGRYYWKELCKVPLFGEHERV